MYRSLRWKLLLVLGVVVMFSALIYFHPPTVGIDLAGGAELIYQVRVWDAPAGRSTSEIMADTFRVLRSRLDPHGLGEVRLKELEDYQIEVQIPAGDLADIESKKNLVGQIGHLEFRRALQRQKQDEVPPESPRDWRPMITREPDVPDDDGNRETRAYWVAMEGDAPLTGERITFVAVHPDMDRPGAFEVGITLDVIGGQQLNNIAADWYRNPMAILLDGELITAPTLESQSYENGCRITGRFSEAYAHYLATVLRAGALPVGVDLVMETIVSPDLSQVVMERGIKAALIAAGLVLLFIFVYYRFAGFIADLALVMNLVIILGTLSFLGWAVSLPGIAALILTVGMAVDANILIFERIREERDRERPLELALKNGYERALVTIVDANVTTLFTAVALGFFCRGPVKGFAWTLIVGIMASMFTAIFATRCIFELFIANGWIKDLKMLRLVKNPDYPVVKIRRVMMFLSLLMVVGGILVFSFKADPGLEFTGGDRLNLRFKRVLTWSQVDSRVAKLGFDNRQIQAISALETEGAGALQSGSHSYKVEVDTFGGIPLARLQEYFNAVLVNPERPATALLDEVDLADLEAPGDLVVQLAHNVREPGVQTLRDLEWLVLPLRFKGEHRLRRLRESVEARDIRLKPVKGQPEGEGETAERNVTQERVSHRLQVSGPGNEPRERGRELELQFHREYVELLLKDVVVWLMTREFQEDLAPDSFGTATIIAGQPPPPETPDDPDLPEIPGDPAGADEPDRAYAGGVELVVNFATGSRMSLPQARKKRDEKDFFGENGHVAILPLTGTAEEAGEEPLAGVRLRIPLSTLRHKAQRFFEELPEGQAPTPELLEAAAHYVATQIFDFQDLSVPIGGKVHINPQLAHKMLKEAVTAILLSLIGIVLYITLRFEFRFGIAAIIALVHDVAIVVGAVVLINLTGVVDGKITMTVIAAVLTIIGYSLNDTIVVFDRIRENLARRLRLSFGEIVNQSINQMLARTLLTSFTTFLAVLTLFVIGSGFGSVIEGFAFAMVVGVIFGTYSSVFIAAPVLVEWGVKRLGKDNR